MEGTGIQPVMSMNPSYGYGDGMFGGGGEWFAIFAILALMWGGGGLFGNGSGGRCATVEDVNNSANFTRLEAQVMNNGSAIRQEAEYIVNGISSLGYQNARDFAALGTQLADCCCTTNRNIDAVRYENAMNTASINATTTAGIQKVLDKLCEDKVSALQGRISQLELQQAVAGVVRYPTSYTYSAGASPFCTPSCGCSGYGYAI